MFNFNFVRPILSSWSRSFQLGSIRHASTSYGNLEMPDKLYKSIRLEIKSAEHRVLKSYSIFIKSAAEHLNIPVGGIFTKKKPSLKRWTVLKSIFVHRKHMVQYEVRTYYKWIILQKMTGSTADTFLEYIERMLPEGVALKVTRYSLEPLPSHLQKDNIIESIRKAGLKTSADLVYKNEEGLLIKEDSHISTDSKGP